MSKTVTKSDSLPYCNYRVLLECKDVVYCRHELVRSKQGVVNLSVCRSCSTRLAPSESPLSNVPSGISVVELERRLFNSIAPEQASPSPSSIAESLGSQLTVGLYGIPSEAFRTQLEVDLRLHFGNAVGILFDTAGRSTNGRRSELHATAHWLHEQCNTPLLLLVRAGVKFGEGSTIVRLIDVLHYDKTVGAVSAAVFNGNITYSGADLDFFRGRSQLVPSTRPLQTTRHGSEYKLIDVATDCTLFRCSMLREQCFDKSTEALEEIDYCWKIKEAARWRVASCPRVKVKVPPEQNVHEITASIPQITREYAHKPAASPSVESMPKSPRFFNHLDCLPNIVLFGVVHSGTSVTTRMLLELGWVACRHETDVDWRFEEHKTIRQLNIAVSNGSRLDESAARAELAQLPQPWVVKDPRFVDTLRIWRSVFETYRPLLIWLTRDVASVSDSFIKRQSLGSRAASPQIQKVENKFAKAKAEFEAWPWMKLRVSFEDLAAAVKQFNINRSGVTKTISETTGR